MTRVLLNLVISLSVLVYVRIINPPTLQKKLFLKTYDYIIVGGGAAGNVIANRLAQHDHSATILLLEAGDDDQKPETEIPAAYATFLGSSQDWKYRTVPQQNSCLSIIDRECAISRGKVIGGSTTINMMIYVRGNKQDYDNWEQLGNHGWSYDECLPYFKKSENYKGKLTEENKEYHGTEGPLTVTPLVLKSRMSDVFLKAIKKMGYRIGDYNAADQLVFQEIDFTIRNGARCSTAKAFLKPKMRDSDLFISLNSVVKKINIDKNTMKATGVTFIHEGEEKIVYASKEVILSAGAIASPQVLLLSGIGPREHLEEKKIEIIHELAGVGQNYADHIGAFITLSTGRNLTKEEISELDSDQAKFQWIHGKGPLTTPGGLEINGFMKSKYLPSNVTYPDLQVNFQSTSWLTRSIEIAKKAYFYNDKLINEFFKPMENKESVSIFVQIIRPNSRGFVKLQTTDIMDHPYIQPNYFQDERDIKILTDGIKKVIKIGNSSYFRDLGYEPYTQKMPGCEDFDFGSDEYWECAIRHLSLVVHHSCGTCKMGPKNDTMAVVDHRLRVHGIRNLRVIDASIMPTVVSGNNNAPTIMIAEKGVQMIIEDNK